MNPQIISPPFPVSRPRRLRRDDFTRRLVREHTLTANDLIYPVFVAAGHGLRQPVPSLPGVVRYSPETLLTAAEEDRKSDLSGKRVSVRFDAGGRRIIQKKNKSQTNIKHCTNIIKK